MLGTNQVSKARHRVDGMLALAEAPFYTIQGEGPSAGTPAVFIRLAGCNLRCYFCDTEFGTLWDDSTLVLPESIAEEVIQLLSKNLNRPSFDHKPLVVITGGEPFLQNFLPLVRVLAGLHMRIEVETAGSLMFDLREARAGFYEQFVFGAKNHIICSPKTPTINAELADLVYAWKYLVSPSLADHDPEDGLPLWSMQARSQGKRARIARPPNHRGRFWHDKIFLQPLAPPDGSFPTYAATNAVNLAKQHGYRVSLQTHKLLGLP